MKKMDWKTYKKLRKLGGIAIGLAFICIYGNDLIEEIHGEIRCNSFREGQKMERKYIYGLIDESTEEDILENLQSYLEIGLND